MATLCLRHMIPLDLPLVQAIEQDCFTNPWTLAEFRDCDRKPGVYKMVVVDGKEIVGYMIFGMQMRCIYLANFAVNPWRQRQGVGAYMVGKLRLKLHEDVRNHMLCEIRETNLAAQLFFQSQGFRYIATVNYGDSSECGYQLRYRVGEPVSAPVKRRATAGAQQ
jgi:ribosomal-protein-alanine N-acetyltransferase